MRDLSVTDDDIDKWLRHAILSIVLAGLQAEGMVGVVPINEVTIHGHLWLKYKQPYDGRQNTAAFQFFFRMESKDQHRRIQAIVQRLKDQAEIRTERKGGKTRFIPTTPLDELARILKVEEGNG